MNPYGITDNSYHLLINAFSQYPEIEKVILFGSRAKGNYKKGSDIDLAIKGKDCNEQIAFNLNAFLNEELPIPYHIDILYYDGLDHKELKEHIDRVGKLFYEAKKDTLVNEPISDYTKKNIEKKDQNTERE